MTEVLEIQLKPSRRKTAAGVPETMEAWLGDWLLCDHKTPICAAARALTAHGMGNAVVRVRSVSGVLAFPATPVAKWAGTTVLEGNATAPRFRKYEPYTGPKTNVNG